MARTRMPPSGKMPVSTAALRTISTTSAISTRASILAEYSIVKCGIAIPLQLAVGDRKVAVHRAVATIIGLDRAALRIWEMNDPQHELVRRQQSCRCCMH